MDLDCEIYCMRKKEEQIAENRTRVLWLGPGATLMDWVSKYFESHVYGRTHVYAYGALGARKALYGWYDTIRQGFGMDGSSFQFQLGVSNFRPAFGARETHIHIYKYENGALFYCIALFVFEYLRYLQKPQLKVSAVKRLSLTSSISLGVNNLCAWFLEVSVSK